MFSGVGTNTAIILDIVSKIYSMQGYYHQHWPSVSMIWLHNSYWWNNLPLPANLVVFSICTYASHQRQRNIAHQPFMVSAEIEKLITNSLDDLRHTYNLFVKGALQKKLVGNLHQLFNICYRQINKKLVNQYKI